MKRCILTWDIAVEKYSHQLDFVKTALILNYFGQAAFNSS
jgi:hypothetical protein